ncbi:hypothetical protein PVAP13_9NG362200 [Panicum virgatum]|uniref:Uncharacterized protein n=1 Tax=Panicum virgatum TaxID=38727 RepID=A0A8T0MVT8_PANVG|nr:hypothetical protein PVAP13_9NG362200 [Panicum virgatum]
MLPGGPRASRTSAWRAEAELRDNVAARRRRVPPPPAAPPWPRPRATSGPGQLALGRQDQGVASRLEKRELQPPRPARRPADRANCLRTFLFPGSYVEVRRHRKQDPSLCLALCFRCRSFMVVPPNQSCTKQKLHAICCGRQ